MTVNHIPHLVEALQRGNLALFLGADLPRDLTGLPSRADLAAGLAQRLGLSGPPPPWPEVTAQYEASAGRNALIRWLRDQLDGCRPGPVYGLLAQLPVAIYLTTAYDSWLYEALRDAGRRPNLPVVDASSLGLRDPGRPTVVHLLGVYDRPESLALTAADLNQLPEGKRQILAGLVHPTLANQSVLLLGQDLRDTYFQTLYQHALFQAGSIRPPAYAIWEGLADWEKQTWLKQEVRVIEMPVMDLLEQIRRDFKTRSGMAATALSSIEIVKDPSDNYYLLEGDTKRRLYGEATLRDVGLKHGLTLKDVRSVSPREVSQFKQGEPIADTTPRILQSRHDGRRYWVKDGVKQEITDPDTLAALAGDIPPDIVSQKELDEMYPGDAIAAYLGAVAQEARPQLIAGKEWGHQYLRLGRFRRHIPFDIKRQVVETIGEPCEEHSERDLENTLIEGLPIQSAEWLIQEWTKRMNRETAATQISEDAGDAAAHRRAPAQGGGLVERSQPSFHAPTCFHDFELLIGDPVDGDYPVHVLASPAGEGEGVFFPPFDEAELQTALTRLESGTTDEAFLADLGARLFRALFEGDVRARYAESTGATTADAGLRLRLRLDPAALHALPWELLRDPEKREFLVLSKRALVTRYLHVPRPTPPLAIEPPLRVLLALAAPKDQPRLDLEAEAEHVRQALRPLLDAGLVTLAVEPHIIKRRLRQRLLDADPHVLHFVGHGGLARDRGVLLLEDGGGNADPLDGPTLGTLLKGGKVRLALLNACLSAREALPEGAAFAGQRAAFLGVGPALVDAGLGAVVAMQFSIPDTSAQLFAEDFYALLARFLPVDECVSRAREALLLEVGLDRADWATPVLFMRAPDGVLWKHERRVKAEVADLQGTKQSATVPMIPPERTDRPTRPMNSKLGQDTESASKKEQEELARTRLSQEISKNLRELDPLRNLAAHIKSLQKQPPSQLTALVTS